MKRLSMGAVTLLLLVSLSSSVATAETTIGVGYEGLFVSEFLHGASVRAWMDNTWALEGNVLQASVDAGTLADVDMWFLGGKVLYAPIIRENSQFYVGVGGGWGNLDMGTGGDVDAWVLGPLFGAEYRFQGLPDLGFNWEVGYQFANIDAGGGTDVDINGISVALGVHYYLR
jgi:hypothetical protein